MALARRLGLVALFGALLWAPVALRGHGGWPLALTQLLILVALAAWLCAMAGAGRLEWRPTALDLPFLLFIGVVAVQLLVGNRPLASWALAPADGPTDFRSPLLTIGTVSPAQTARSLGLFLTYLATYVLVVNLVRERRQLVRLVRVLVALGGLLAFLGLLEYLVGETWVLRGDATAPVKRLAATFANPDHFGTWLAMLIALGIGLLAAGRRHGGEATSILHVFTSREAREDAIRRYLPAIAIVIMALGLLFTLSRGAVASLLAGALVVLALLGAIGRARWSLVVVGALVAVVAGYGSWIGLQPLLARFGEGQMRILQAVSSLPMLRDFPALGVGLGGYKDIYLRYQPAALGAGKAYFPYAHNDILQLVIELGPLGAALLVFAVWRGAQDLVWAHLLGRGACPVDGGEGELAQRHDPFSVGIAIGAVGAVVALLVHSLVDFSARIPANGLLGAACLGIATVVVHTRFDRSAELLTAERIWRLGPWACRVLCVAALLGAAALVPIILRPALVEVALAGKSVSAERIARAFRLDPRDPKALALRASRRADDARRIRETGLDAEGQTVPLERREEQARGLLTGAVVDLRSALASTPTDPFVHEQLGWTFGTLATVDATRANEWGDLALAHLRRALALAPDNPFLHRSLAAYALTWPTALLPVALEAARGAVRLDLDLLPDLVDRFVGAGLGDVEWALVTPDAWVPRLVLGSLLEARERFHEAEAVYRDAIARGPAADVIGPWLLARVLTRRGQGEAAAAEADRALARAPRNPEIELVKAEALATAANPAALDVYRLAVQHGDMAARRLTRDPLPFTLDSATGQRFVLAPAREESYVRALVVARLGERVEPVRYHRALARYLTDRRLWEQAGQEWDVVLAETPRDAEAQFLRGRVWEAQGARDRALEHYRQAIALDARPAFRLALARLLWETEQFFQAMNEWRAILDKEPENVEALLGLAQAHLKEGDRLAAFHRYQRVLQLTPDNVTARRELAKLTGAPK